MKLADPDGLAPSPLKGRDRPSAQLSVHFYQFDVQGLGTVEVFESPVAPVGLFMLSVLNGVSVATVPYSH